LNKNQTTEKPTKSIANKGLNVQESAGMMNKSDFREPSSEFEMKERSVHNQPTEKSAASPIGPGQFITNIIMSGQSGHRQPVSSHISINNSDENLPWIPLGGENLVKKEESNLEFIKVKCIVNDL